MTHFRLFLTILVLVFVGCSRTPIAPDNSIVSFPAAVGTSLDGRTVNIAQELKGSPSVILVGLLQDSQFDIDRWVLGILQLKLPVKLLELPTIPATIPTMLSERINSGMKSGIPAEDWPSVITLYGAEADKIVQVTGSQNPRNAHVVLVDKDGKILWTYDRGYSAGKVIELQEKISALPGT